MRLRILIDVDGTCANLHHRCVEIMNLRLLLSLSDASPYTMDNAVRNRYVEKGLELTPEDSDWLYDNYIDAPEFASSLDPLPGCIDAIQKLHLEHEVFFLTDRKRSSKTWTFDRDGWLEKHFGRELGERTIYTGHKYAVPGNLLIEDSHEIAERWMKENQNRGPADAFLFSWKYNSHTNFRTFSHWNEFSTLFTQLEEAKYR
jgi:5'(3')-deoxyribonucleotidase